MLGGDRDLAAAIYGASPEGNFEGWNNLHRFADLDEVAARFALTPDELAERRTSIDRRLRAVRSTRVPPERDDKLVAAWNGLALRAFAEAGKILGDQRYVDRARSIAAYLTTTGSPDGKLVRSWRDRPGHPAFAEDLAAVAVGLYSLYATTGETEWFDHAERLVAQLRDHFAAESGGFHSTADTTELFTRPIDTQDNPTPSTNALALEALLMHAAYTGDLSAHADAEGAMKAIAGTALQYPSFGGYGLAVWLTHLVGFDEVAVVGTDTAAMQDVLWSAFRPNAIVAIGDGSPGPVPLLADRPLTDRTQAYVCRNLVCDLPVDTPEALASKLTP